jgi:DNA-binding transcriptional MerR regulator
MKMKEICSRTGLTDRAVRLYIENGLVTPRRVSGYSGRESIIFDEENLLMLSNVAVLRRAGFAIADIKRMQVEPGCIMETVAAYREQLGEEIRQKEKVYGLLGKMQNRNAADITGLAGFIESAAGEGNIPKEDMIMTKKDIYENISKNILAVISLAFLITGGIWTVVMMSRVAMYYTEGISILAGGGIKYHNVFSIERLAANWVYVPVTLCLIIAVVFLIIYIIKGKLPMLIASGAGVIVAILLLIVLPEQSGMNLYCVEFMSLRHSFLWDIAQKSDSYDWFVYAFKYIILTLSLILSGTAAFVKIRAAKPDK